MNRLHNRSIRWVGWVVGCGVLYYSFSRLFHMPFGALITLSLIITWLIPRPWRFVVPLGIAVELAAVTPPLALGAALCSPLLIFWLRGRIEVDLSFSYLLLIASSAALAFAIALLASAPMFWQQIPWLLVLPAWVAATALALGITIVLHDRHY